MNSAVNTPALPRRPEVLEAMAETMAREVWVVAPEHDQSGVSHSISLHAPLRVAIAVSALPALPADCVIVGSRHLLPAPPDLVLSGINRGANLGVETVFSGTVGGPWRGFCWDCPPSRSAKPSPIATRCGGKQHTSWHLVYSGGC